MIWSCNKEKSEDFWGFPAWTISQVQFFFFRFWLISLMYMSLWLRACALEECKHTAHIYVYICTGNFGWTSCCCPCHSFSVGSLVYVAHNVAPCLAGLSEPPKVRPFQTPQVQAQINGVYIPDGCNLRKRRCENIEFRTGYQKCCLFWRQRAAEVFPVHWWRKLIRVNKRRALLPAGSFPAAYVALLGFTDYRIEFNSSWPDGRHSTVDYSAR